MEHLKHAVHAWLDKMGHDADWLAAELKKIGLNYEASYITQVFFDGYYAPGRKLQNGVHKVTGVPVAKIAGYPYRAARAA